MDLSNPETSGLLYKEPLNIGLPVAKRAVGKLGLPFHFPCSQALFFSTGHPKVEHKRRVNTHVHGNFRRV